jgi:hypothetical protein
VLVTVDRVTVTVVDMLVLEMDRTVLVRTVVRVTAVVW